MTDQPLDKVDREQEERESEQDELLEEQEHKGYGDDEGEREDALPE
jgi:predicted DNA-binding WGR domain protein